MATSTEVDVALDAVAQLISDQREVLKKAKSNAAIASAALAAVPTTYADVVSTIQAYGTTNAHEALAKARLAKYTTEFQALKAIADGVAGITP